jgi:hypothetical protein
MTRHALQTRASKRGAASRHALQTRASKRILASKTSFTPITRIMVYMTKINKFAEAV